MLNPTERTLQLGIAGNAAKMKPLSRQIEDLDLEAVDLEATDAAGALDLWRQALRLAQEDVEKDPCYESCSNFGYVAYMIWARDGSGFDLALGHFVRALEFRPAACMARFYIGRMYFEAACYREACTVMEEIRRESGLEFVRRDQAWRYFSALETLVAARLWLGEPIEVSDKLWRELEEFLDSIDDDDRGTLTLVTLLSSLDHVRQAGAPRLEAEFYRAVGRLVERTRSTSVLERLFPALIEVIANARA